MSTTDVHEMSDDELRREIAERLGYTWEWAQVQYTDPTDDEVETVNDFVIRDPSGENVSIWWYGVYNYTEARAWDHARIPDWPGDTGAAFELCVEVLDRLNAAAEYPVYEFEMDNVGIGIVPSNPPLDVDGRGALALSRLALLALREMGEGDE